MTGGSVDKNDSNKDGSVRDKHRELHHYTNWDGLSGILKEKTLWATKYKYLNDYTEIEHVRPYLIERLTDLYIQRYSALTDVRSRTIFQKHGGLAKVAAHEADRFVGILYDVNYKHGGRLQEPFTEPFILSFCSHSKDKEYERDNGLLSQWRSYGRLEGYALVFDTAELEAFMNREADCYHYGYLEMYEVVYDSDEHFSKAITPLLDELNATASELEIEGFKGHMPHGAFIKTTTGIKHRAFYEEREIRMVAAPLPLSLMQKIESRQDEKFSRDKSAKSIYRRPSGAEYIKLFDSIDMRDLPIKRIIIGPHSAQDELQKKVDSLVSGKVETVKSRTPLRW